MFFFLGVCNGLILFLKSVSTLTDLRLILTNLWCALTDLRQKMTDLRSTMTNLRLEVEVLSFLSVVLLDAGEEYLGSADKIFFIFQCVM